MWYSARWYAERRRGRDEAGNACVSEVCKSLRGQCQPCPHVYKQPQMMGGMPTGLAHLYSSPSRHRPRHEYTGWPLRTQNPAGARYGSHTRRRSSNFSSAFLRAILAVGGKLKIQISCRPEQRNGCLISWRWIEIIFQPSHSRPLRYCVRGHAELSEAYKVRVVSPWADLSAGCENIVSIGKFFLICTTGSGPRIGRWPEVRPELCCLKKFSQSASPKS